MLVNTSKPNILVRTCRSKCFSMPSSPHIIYKLRFYQFLSHHTVVLHNLNFNFPDVQKSGLNAVSQVWLHHNFQRHNRNFSWFVSKFFSSDARFQWISVYWNSSNVHCCMIYVNSILFHFVLLGQKSSEILFTQPCI